ncbi:hypothetical protein ACFV1L_07940 [Kitasatospora sp. NPDC059646]|uniref:hypothetical protein n=1 Tax=Kitasatospora sp. NPDC059646 TaxID=3346893 RepID=UPI0036D1A466
MEQFSSEEITAVARDVALFLEGRGQRADGTYPAALLRSAAVAAVLLQRRTAMTTSVITPAAKRVPEPGIQADLLSRVYEAAVQAGDLALAQLLDWAGLAWAGRTRNGLFFVAGRLPQDLQAGLGALVAQGKSCPMLSATGTLVLREQAASLRQEAERLAALDREFARKLFLEPVTAVLHDVSRGVVGDHGFLADSPAEHMARTNAGRPRPIPANGSRWGPLLKAVGAVQKQVADLLEVAGSHAWTEPEPFDVPLDGLDPELRRVLQVSVFRSPAVDEPAAGDGPVLARIFTEAMAAASPAAVHRVAMVARFAGLPEEVTGPALRRLEHIREQADELLAKVTDDPDGTSESMHSLTVDALARGDLDGAEQGLDLLAEAVVHRIQQSRLVRLQQAVERGAGNPNTQIAERHLRSARLHAERGDTETCASYLDEAEQLLSPGRPAGQPPAAEPAKTDAADAADDRRSGGEAQAAALIAACRSRSSLAGGAGEVTTALESLGSQGSHAVVLRTARELLSLDPRTAVRLLDTCLKRDVPTMRPVLWHVLEEALRLCGDVHRADEVYLLGHPPLPPVPLVLPATLGPLAGVELLKPWLASPMVTDRSPEHLRAAVTRATENETAAAAAYTDALRAGSAGAFGPAIGWLVASDRAPAALDLYRTFGPRHYLTAGAVWNVASAYAAAGLLRQTVESLHVLFRVMGGTSEQTKLAREFLALHGSDVPAVPAPRAPRPAPQPALSALGPEAAAKQLYGAGRVTEAVNRLEELLETSANSPGIFLLLRILRERPELPNALGRAIAAVDRLERVTWRHHVEIARNALEANDLALAAARLQAARDQGDEASETWIAPLAQRLQARQGAQAHAFGVPDQEPVPVTSRLAPADWDREIAEALADGSDARLGELVSVVRGAHRREPWLAGNLVTAVRTRPIRVRADNPVVADLRMLVEESRDGLLVCEFAGWLSDCGEAALAVEVIEGSLGWANRQALPQLLRQRAASARAAGIDESRLQPPALPPRLERAGTPSREDPGFAQVVHINEPLGRAGRQPAIRHALDLANSAPDGLVANAWVEAVRSGGTAAFNNALGYLVRAGRPVEAIKLYGEYSDAFWLGAGPAWNLGCAYAAAGYVESAVLTFDYHARLATFRYSAEQLLALRPLFAAVGRPVPVTSVDATGLAAGPSSAPRSTGATGADAVALIARARETPTHHNVLLAGNAARRAMQRCTPEEAEAFRVAMEEIYALLPDPRPNLVAEFALVLAAAGRATEAWSLLVEAIDRTRANPRLLDAAVRLARELDKSRQLRLRLERYVTGAGFELHLNLAKLAELEGDDKARVQHANLALAKNPTCAEAIQLRDRASGGTAVSERSVPARPQVPRIRDELMNRIGARRTADLEEVVHLLNREYRRQVDDLRTKALLWYQPKVDTDIARRLPIHLQEDAGPAVRAAVAQDWDRAAFLFRELLTRAPRNTHVAEATAACMTLARMYDDANQIGQTLRHTPSGQRILVQLLCTRRDFTSAAALQQKQREDGPLDLDAAIARAGLLAGLCDRPADAARTLLRFVDRLPYGYPAEPVALAVLLAHRAGDRELLQETIGVLRRRTPKNVDELVNRALQSAPEALNESTVPALTPRHIELVVEKLADSPRRQEAFLRDGIGRTHTDLPGYQEEQEARNRLLVRCLEARGLVVDAYEQFWTWFPRSSDQPAAVAELLSFCARIGHPEGYRSVLRYLEEIGAPAAPEQVRALDAIEDGTAHRPPEDLDDLVVRVARCTPDELPTEVATVARALVACAGANDARWLETIAGIWRKVAVRLAMYVSTADPVRSAARSADVIESQLAQQEELCRNLLAPELRDRAQRVGAALRLPWDDLARDSMKLGTVSQVPLDIWEAQATRLDRGPVEVQLNVRAARRSLSAIVLTVTPPDRPEVLGRQVLERVEADSQRSCFLAVKTDLGAVKITASAVLSDGTTRETSREVPVREVPPDPAMVTSRFKPRSPAVDEMFVGRARELELLRSTYASAWRGGTDVLFMTGSRRAGKTSILRRLTAVRRPSDDGPLPPDEWPTPRAFPVSLDGQGDWSRARSLLSSVAQAVSTQVRRTFRGSIALDPFDDISTDGFRNWWLDVRLKLWPDQDVGLLLIVDEFQELLEKLIASQVMKESMEALRSLKDDGTLALLFIGSCSTARLRRLLRGSLVQQEFSERLRVGPLDRASTLEVFRRGFHERVTLLPEAVESVWELTAGHPHHIHMIGQQVVECLSEEQRSVVDLDLVHYAEQRVAERDDTVKGMLDPLAEDDGELKLLLDIAEELQYDALETSVRTALGPDQSIQLDSFLDFGLLVRTGRDLAWANPVVRDWMNNQSRKHGARQQRHPAGTRPVHQPLIAAGFRFDEDLPGAAHDACVVSRRGDASGPLEARHFPGQGRALLRFHALLTRDGRTDHDGLPRVSEPCGDWMLSEHIKGTTVLARLEGKRRREVKPMEEAALWVLRAAEALARVNGDLGLTHGDIRPENLLIPDHSASGQQLYVTNWGFGMNLKGGLQESLMPAVRSDYWIPDRLRGTGTRLPTPAEDTYALSAVLYQLLHPLSALPYGAGNAHPDRIRDIPERLGQVVHLGVTQGFDEPEKLARALREVLRSHGAPNAHRPDPSPAPEARRPQPEGASVVVNNYNHNYNKLESQMSQTPGFHNSGSITGNVQLGNNNRVTRSTANHSVGPDLGGEGVSLQDLARRLREQVAEAGNGLDPVDAADMNVSLDRLDEEVGREEPSPGRISRLAQGIKAILEGFGAAAPALPTVERLIELTTG